MGKGQDLELRARIARAFAAATYPGDAAIATTRPCCPGYEGNVAAAFPRRRDWRELTCEELLEGDDAPLAAMIAFLEPRGIAYYLPAFLLMALDLVAGREGDQRADALYGFVDSLCFHLSAPSPNALREQYEIVKDMKEVPENIKERLRDPSPEAGAAERALVQRHRELRGLLDDEQKACVRATLERVAGYFRPDAPDEACNSAARALATSWGALAGG